MAFDPAPQGVVALERSPQAGPRVVPRQKRRRKLAFENRVLLLALLAGLPGGLVALLILWTGDYSSKVQWTIMLGIASVWLSAAFALRGAVVRPLQTMSNLVAALREEDFSIRGRVARADDALGEVLFEINTLSETLRDQRLGALESAALLRTVLSEIDVAIFAFDVNERLRLVNRAGERLLAQNMERLLGRTAAELGLGACLQGPAAQTLEMTFAGASGRWGMRRNTFRLSGAPHQLLVLADLSRALREEERAAWQRMVRVLGHELNNSLAPVRSIADSLETLLKRDKRPADWEEDVRRGLRVIAERAEALTRFMRDYARLTRLPQPALQPVPLAALIRRVAGLETRLPVQVQSGPEVTIQADPDQLEQLLINLIRNAVEASLENGAGAPVAVGWSKNGREVDVWVRDEGPGLPNSANLFVPFFTTKPSGSGIGLAISRQIAEAHGGTLTLRNRRPGPGAEARLRMKA